MKRFDQLRMVFRRIILVASLLCLLVSGGNTQLKNAANEFSVGFARNIIFPGVLTLFVSTPEPTSVVFNVTANGFFFSGVATNNDTTEVSIPNSLEVRSNALSEREKGILVKAEGDRRIVVYGLSEIASGSSSDAFLALPCSTLAGTDEYEYYAVGYIPLNGFPSVLLIVACEDNTVVTLPGSTTITLERLQTYEVTDPTDFTGTRVISTKPISVFSGAVCADIPTSAGACDHLIEQVPPTATWGTSFLVASLLGRDTGERLRILTAQPSSTVTVNCTTFSDTNVFSLSNAGDWMEIEIAINSYCSIEASSPVFVTQYAYGSSAGSTVGDPFMMMIPPIEQYSNNYVLNSPSQFPGNYFTVYAAPEYFQPQSIFLDDSTIDEWFPVHCSNEEVCGYISRVSVSSGTHRLYHENSLAQVGVSAYGFESSNSYGYPGGLNLSPLRSVPSITLDASQSPITVMEGMSVDACVTISEVLDEPILVTLSTFPTGDNAATEGLDYPEQLTTTIPPGMTQSCVSIPITIDNVVELSPESFGVVISTTIPALVVNSTSELIVNIQDNIVTVMLDTSLSPINAEEGTEVNVCVNISEALDIDLEVLFNAFPIGHRGASEGMDYPDQLTTTIPPGMTQSCVSILLTDDDVIEGPQTFSVGIRSTSPALTDNSTSDFIIVIEDNDELKLGFQESEYSFPEASGVNFSVCIESIGQTEISVSFILTVESITPILRDAPRKIHILGGIHIIGADAGPMNALTDETLCINITNDEDGLKEGTQLHMLRLETNDSLVCLGRDQALLIEEANGVCSLSISTLEPSVNESAGSVEFCVALDQLPIQDIVSARLSLRPGDAEESVDYIPIDTIFEWHQDSSLEQCTDIPIVNDLLVEEAEFFFVDVVSEDVTLTTMVSIIDDDSVQVDFRTSFLETDESAEVISSCVYICNGELQRNVTLLVHVLNGSASYPDDFTVGSSYYEITFTSENSDRDLCVNISIIDNSIFETVEYFGLSLSSLDSGVEFKQETAQIAISDNDCVNISLSQESYTVEEATGSVQICALLVGELETTVDGMILTIPGDAFDVLDFSPDAIPGSQFIEFSESGEQCVNITIAMDEVLEETEFFSVILASRDDRVKVILHTARIYIIDTGTVTVGFSQVTYSVSEEDGNGSGSILEVCIEVQGTVSIDRTVVITMSATDGSAVGGLDYNEFLQTEMVIDLTFETDIPGKRKRRTVNPEQECTSVTILSDSVIENDEDFQLLLTTDDADVILIPSNTTVVIVDNDYANVTIEQDEYVVAEEGGNVTVCAVLTGGELERGIAFNIISIDDSAKDSEDYEAIQSFPLNFLAASPINASVCVVFQILDNDVVEEDEQFFVSLSTDDTVHFEPVGIASVIITDTDVITIKLTETSYTANEAVMFGEIGVEIVSGSHVCMYSIFTVITIKLTETSYTANEAVMFGEIGVEIVSGSLATEVCLTVFTTTQPEDTASPGDDYTELSDVLLIPSGSMTGDIVYFNISIVNDIVVEELYENFTINLNDTSQVVVLEPSSSEVKIMEDLTDRVFVGFVSANNEVTEGDNGTVCVQITGELAREMIVSVTGMSETAEGSSVDHDFPQAMSITFNTSPDMHCIEYLTTQDEVYEDDEMFTGLITTTDSQVVLSVVNTTVTIMDDDKVGFSLSVDESVCEGAGIVLACVQLETDIEMDAVATLEATDGIAQDPVDYIATSVTFRLSAPLPARALFCIPVRIIDDSVLEPCEDFILSVTSSSVRSCIVGDNSASVVINDDEDITTDLLLFNNSPQISGTNLTAYFTLTGCAQVLCEVKSRTRQIDCSPAVGSFEGKWFAPSVTGRNTLQNMAITVQPYCTGQVVPEFEDRPFRTDNIQCSQHFTDQQYSFDSASGDVTVEWEGTGPNETVQVSEFTCNVNGGTSFSCTSPTILSGLALTPGNYTLNVFPVGIDGCTRMVRRNLLISV